MGIALLSGTAFPITWTTGSTQLSSSLLFDGYPSLTQARDGKIWLVWARPAYLGYKAILYSTSSDLGYHWTPTDSLTPIDDGYEDSDPDITQAINGSLWVVWTSNRPPPSNPKPDFGVRASPDSLTAPQNSVGLSTITVTSLYNFSETVNLTVSGTPLDVQANLNPTQVTPPPNGKANSTLTITVGPSATPGNYTLTVTGTSTGGIPITHHVQIALQIVPEGSLSRAAQTVLAPIALEGTQETYDYEIFYQTSPDNGATWSSFHQLTENTVNDLAPAILQLRNGTIFVFYSSFVGGNGDDEIFYKYSSNGGVSWTTCQLTSNTDVDSSPSAIQTSDNKIWVTWHSQRSNNYDVYYRIYNGQWMGETRLTHDSQLDTCPSILETLDGLKYVFWTGSDETPDSTDDIYYSYTSNNGASWSDPTLFTDTVAFNDSWTCAVQVRDTSVWVVWASDMNGNYEIYLRTSLVGDLTGPENPPGSGSYPPDGGIDVNDLVFMRKAYGTKQGDPGWTQYSISDITGPENPPNSVSYPPDNVVSVYDLFALGKNYGRS
jgi:hypothetical protein